MAHWHTIRQGDSLPSLAHRYGFADWKTIYDHPKNEGLRKERPDANVLYPGDKVFIPSKEQKYVDCAPEQVHRFQLKRAMTQVRLVLEAEDGTVFAGKKYALKVGDLMFEGATDGGGLLEQKVPAIADRGELTLWYDDSDPTQSFTWELEIGHLDPVDTVSGAQARLNNLGFDCGTVDGRFGDRSRSALRAFQEREGLPLTGELDAATLAKLSEVHGS